MWINKICLICGMLLLISGLLMVWLSEDVERTLQPAEIKTGYYRDGKVVFTGSGKIGGNAEGEEYARIMKKRGRGLLSLAV